MTVLLAFDPGLKNPGCALFVDGMFTRADYLNVRSNVLRGPERWRHVHLELWTWLHHNLPMIYSLAQIELVSEWPRVYTGSKSGGDPADLVQLAGLVGFLSSQFSTPTLFEPWEWKQQQKKEISHARIAERLTREERLLLPDAIPTKASLWHNAWDAVGIGLKHLGRFERARVLHR